MRHVVWKGIWLNRFSEHKSKLQKPKALENSAMCFFTRCCQTAQGSTEHKSFGMFFWLLRKVKSSCPTHKMSCMCSQPFGRTRNIKYIVYQIVMNWNLNNEFNWKQLSSYTGVLEPKGLGLRLYDFLDRRPWPSYLTSLGFLHWFTRKIMLTSAAPQTVERKREEKKGGQKIMKQSHGKKKGNFFLS